MLLVTVQVVVAETSTVVELPDTVAKAEIVPNEPAFTVSEVGISVRPITLLRETVMVAVPVAAPEDAVMVAVPELAPVTLPPDVMGAIAVSLVDQKTLLVRVLVLPSS